jgi:gliding motility-associated lipoprotein GldB
MKKLLTLSVLFFIVLACDEKSKVEKAVEQIPLEVKVERFDKLFFETPPEGLAALKAKYPYFFPGDDDSVWLEKMQHPQWRELYNEVQKVFPDFQKETQGIEDLFRHVKYYYPQTRAPKVVTLISEMDYANKVIYADSLLLVSLELYLGKDHEFYQFPEYLKQNFTKSQLLPDVATAVAEEKVKAPENNTLLAMMTYFGKELYLKSLFLPDATDADLIGYTPEQIAWCQENEAYIWRYLIDGELLYSTDPKLPNRFINPAPFSKFYLEIDNESPGRIGQWVGWQIVKSYVKNNSKTPLNELLDMDSKKLFENSRYKPKKD